MAFPSHVVESQLQAERALFHVGCIGLTYLVQAHNLTVRLLDLPQLGKEVPEARLGYDIVGCEDAHAVEFWCFIVRAGKMAPNDLILRKSGYLSRVILQAA